MLKKSLLKLWINHKRNQGIRKGWIGPVSIELDFMRQKTLSEIHALKYKQDRAASGIPWDYQGDSVEAFKREGVDCNWINRVWQIWNYLNFKQGNTFLVTMLHKPCKLENLWRFYTPKNWLEKIFYIILNWLGIALAHATTVYIKGDKILAADYGAVFPGVTVRECLERLAEHQYGVKLDCFVAQNLYWKVVNLE